MPVLTLSREIGSDGTFIGQQVVERLGYRFVDKVMLANILEEYGIQSAEFNEVYEGRQNFWERASSRTEDIIRMLNKTLLALAYHGNIVIMGRGSYVVLGNFADVLNVRVKAPFAYRVQRIMTQERITQAQAETLVKENDRKRISFVKTAYHVHWNSTRTFDVVIDTSKVHPATAVDWLVDAVRALPDRVAESTGDRPTTAEIEPDSVLAQFLSERFLTPV